MPLKSKLKLSLDLHKVPLSIGTLVYACTHSASSPWLLRRGTVVEVDTFNLHYVDFKDSDSPTPCSLECLMPEFQTRFEVDDPNIKTPFDLSRALTLNPVHLTDPTRIFSLDTSTFTGVFLVRLPAGDVLVEAKNGVVLRIIG